jgi:transcriptional regulator of NAD metabolism
MTPAERREAVLEKLRQSEKPVSAGALAQMFHVSRQIIVGDIALLRASQHEISATPRGYLLATGHSGLQRTVACRHKGDAALRAELYAVTDHGCGLLDVTVDHPLYGELRGQLRVFSRYDADDFIERLHASQAPPLSLLTDGVHLHTLQCPNEEAFQHVKEALARLGILYQPESDQV